MIGVEGVLEPVEEVSWEAGDPLKLMAVTDRERTPRGSSGIGLSGWEVCETGKSWTEPFRGRIPIEAIVAAGMIALVEWAVGGQSK